MTYDVIIIGGGPAGLTAALYSLRANKTVLIIEKEAFGGQITHSPKVENYPGFTSLSGNELADKMVEQVLSQGADVEIDTVLNVTDNVKTKTVTGESGNYIGKTVIIATGVKHRLLGVENENKFLGNGISFCAVCDGAFYKDMDVAMVGGGNSALQEAILLSETCNHVTIIQNLPYFTGEQKLADIIKSKKNIEVIFNAKVTGFTGDTELDGVNIELENNTSKHISVSGVFIAIGLIPQNEPFKEYAELNNYGYFNSDENCLTKTKGIFVAGDCRFKNIRQVTTATADGATSALAACNYLDSLNN